MFRFRGYVTSHPPILPYPICPAIFPPLIPYFPSTRPSHPADPFLLHLPRRSPPLPSHQLGASSRPSALAGLLWSVSPLAAAAEAEAALASVAAAAAATAAVLGGGWERGAAGEARHWGFGCTVVRGGKVVDEPSRHKGLLLGQATPKVKHRARRFSSSCVLFILSCLPLPPPPIKTRRPTL
ncbi:unnamed protein product [Closterium sp. Naga37s-1]|nr:unnamed protein product [Closterium sp. Naga37s-1]